MATNPRAHGLRLVPCTLAQSRAFVEAIHRHHRPPVGHLLSLAVADNDGRVRGVAVVSRPVSRHIDNGWTAEVTRLATDGARNACSLLYSAAWRAAKLRGMTALCTYILDTEDGASLRAAGWSADNLKNKGGEWSSPSRQRKKTDCSAHGKTRWWAPGSFVPHPVPALIWPEPKDAEQGMLFTEDGGAGRWERWERDGALATEESAA